MENNAVFRHIEVEVNFRTAVMRMAWHRVPHVAWFQQRHAHNELAALNAVRVDVFIDRPLIGVCNAAQDGQALLR